VTGGRKASTNASKVASADAVEAAAAVEAATERLFRLTVNRKMYARQAAAVGAVVTRAGYALRRTLDDSGPLNTGELARRSHMDPGATVRQVKALEADGLVTRANDDGDARVTVVTLTDRGRGVVESIVEVRTAHLEEILADWSETDRANLARLVDRLVDGLQTTPFRPHLKEQR